jgi:Na+/H+ antiporter NhaD/arsenite permease-like protein
MSDVLAIVIFVGAYVLIATEWVHRVVVALAGAGLMLLFKIVDANDAFHSDEFGIDWAVILLLFGMMIIIGVLRRTGLFEYLAILSAKQARGRPIAIMILLVVITAIASALLDNVTTMLLIAPVTVLLADRIGVSPVPLLVAEVFASNIGGTATLVGDPPNIIIGSAAGLSYLDFLVNLGPIVVVLLVVFSFQARWMFRRELTFQPDRISELMQLDEREALLPGSLLPKALVVLGAVTLAFVLQGSLGYDPSIVALLGAGVLLLIARGDRVEYLRDIEWPTLVFFIGLFIMVGALVKTGVIEELADRLVELTDGRLFLATAILLIASAVLSALVDNIPYVATMVPIVGTLAATIPGDTTVLWWALALGADLGGNATSIGASANVVVLGVAERSGHPIKFARFFRYGAPVSTLSIALALAYLWLRYFAFV